MSGLAYADSEPEEGGVGGVGAGVQCLVETEVEDRKCLLDLSLEGNKSEVYSVQLGQTLEYTGCLSQSAKHDRLMSEL